jgi:LytS/YehU family sensor histidine kinase
MNWLKDHVFIAAWCSPSIALVALIIRNTLRPSERVNWSMIMLYVAFLTCLAAVLTPGIDMNTRVIASVPGGLLFGTITIDALWWKK